MPEIREPIKTTSIEKKQKIIDAGLKLFSEKGYYKTNTAKIAKAAGVSTAARVVTDVAILALFMAVRRLVKSVLGH